MVVSLVEAGETNAVVSMQRKVGIDAKVEAVSVEHLRAPKASTVKPAVTTADALSLTAPKQAPAPKITGKATAPGTAGTMAPSIGTPRTRPRRGTCEMRVGIQLDLNALWANVLAKYIGSNPFDWLGDETSLGLGIAMFFAFASPLATPFR